MTKRMMFWVLVVVVIAVGIYRVFVRYLTSDEARVRSVIESVISGLERDNVYVSILSIKDHLSKDYRHRGEGVQIDKQSAIRYIGWLKQSMGYVDLKVERREMSIKVTGNTARVEMIARVTAARKDRPDKRAEIVTEPGRNRAIVNLAKEDGEWMIVGSERAAGEWEEPAEE